MISLTVPAGPAAAPAIQSTGAIIRHFTPAWFAVTMGNGIVSAVLAAVPQVFAWQGDAARLLWVANAFLFVVFSFLLIARFAISPSGLLALLRHPAQSMFLGTIPMGLAPTINGLIVFVAPDHPGIVPFAHGLWIFDAVLSIVIALVVPLYAFTQQSHALERVTSLLLLPLVAPEVAAASAAVLAPHLPAESAANTVIAGYALWAVSVPLAFMVLTILVLRLLLHKLPARELAVSSWLTIGPIGTGALGLVTLGQAAPAAFAGTALQSVAMAARDFGILGGIVMWALGLWWLATAILLVLSYVKNGLPFNLGWWGFTFPLGVLTMATLSLARVTSLHFFQTIGVALALLLFALWSMVAARTLRGAIRHELFTPQM